MNLLTVGRFIQPAALFGAAERIDSAAAERILDPARILGQARLQGVARR